MRCQLRNFGYVICIFYRVLGIAISKVVVVYVTVSRDPNKCNFNVHVTEGSEVIPDSSEHMDVMVYLLSVDHNVNCSSAVGQCISYLAFLQAQE